MTNYSMSLSVAQMGGKVVKLGDTVGVFIPKDPNYIYISEQGKAYINLLLSENQNKQYHDASIKISVPKAEREKLPVDKRNIYVGNANEMTQKEFDTSNVENVEQVETISDNKKGDDDLPF